jgi:hypothetical protein
MERAHQQPAGRPSTPASVATEDIVNVDISVDGRDVSATRGEDQAMAIVPARRRLKLRRRGREDQAVHFPGECDRVRSRIGADSREDLRSITSEDGEDRGNNVHGLGLDL